MEIKALVSQMTLEEKAGLCSGLDFWHTKSVERLGVPSVMVSDGPHGLRKQDDKGDHLGMNDSIKAVCMPAASATAASFDRDLIRKMGEAIGDSCQHEKLSVVLGPAVNIKRSPLCGRNFEYFSEDPYLAGEMSAAYINGVQSRNVGTSIKHFAANNQEHRRMSSSSNADERTLREIYFPAFETSVKKAQPWTVMCSYNRINGVYASENPWLLTDVLRKEWGFEGYVMSDWGAVSNRVAGVAAGLDLEMPSSGGINDARIVEAVRSGKLDEKLVDQAVERILTINFRYLENAKPETPWDMEAQHLLSADIAADCMVLLKNEGILPLSQDEEAAFIGEFAVKPRFQGGGSSHINCFKTTSALEAAEGKKVTYARGYSVAEDAATDEMIAEAVAAAKKAKVAVVFAGLPDAYESEGYDRSHMRMPDCQNELIDEICKVQENVIVVLHNGSPVEMPWNDKVSAVLEVYLCGEATGEATADILFGKANPCGKLAETIPMKLSDTPCYLTFPGDRHAEYNEGVFVGYRYYDKKEMAVRYPFGHGLSYTTFEYSDIKLSDTAVGDDDILTVNAVITNTGNCAGKEIVQLYVADKSGFAVRPEKELKDFIKIELQPGESKTVTFRLDKRAFSYYNEALGDWYAPNGKYDIMIASSSRDIRLTAEVTHKTAVKLPFVATENTVFGEFMDYAEGKATLDLLFSKVAKGLLGGEHFEPEAVRSMIGSMPLRQIRSFGGISDELLQQAVDMLNKDFGGFKAQM